jgi:3-methylfumaryl-CoA hydratase
MSGSTIRPSIGHPDVVTRTELITPASGEALAGMLDIDPPGDGETLPALWHWVYLLERRAQRDLGPDGHPTTGIPAPPDPGRLRMFAGGRVVTHELLRFGVAATRTTRLVRSVEKQGRSGSMIFSTVRHDIEQGGRTVISDEQDIVYRVAGSTPAPRTPPAEHPAGEQPATASLELPVDPVLLFRFSALTYNAHRIHYDATYSSAEGYPDLVVHGPLQALLMGECLRRSGTPMVGRQFSYRLLAPTYGTQRLRVTAWPDQQGQAAQVLDGRGRRTATARLELLDQADTSSATAEHGPEAGVQR